MYDLLPHLRSEITIIPVPGKAIVLVGENGVGKSTFLKHHYEHHGGIFCDQKPLDIFFDRTLGEFRNNLLSASDHIDEASFEKFWSASGLSSKEGRKLSELSGGELQLLKVISICCAQGDTYLLDEPAQYLDREKKKLLGDIIRMMLQLGRSLLIVEHDYSWLPEGASINELGIEQDVLKVKRSWTI